TEEARSTTGVAGDPALLLDLQQHRVAVAVDADLAHVLHVARRLALAPQPATRTRPVDGAPGSGRLRERFTVHPRQHQHLAGARILRYDRDQSVVVPADRVEPARVALRCRGVHRGESGKATPGSSRRTGMPHAARCSFAWWIVYSPKWKMLAASTA